MPNNIVHTVWCHCIVKVKFKIIILMSFLLVLKRTKQEEKHEKTHFFFPTFLGTNCFQCCFLSSSISKQSANTATMVAGARNIYLIYRLNTLANMSQFFIFIFTSDTSQLVHWSVDCYKTIFSYAVTTTVVWLCWRSCNNIISMLLKLLPTT